MFGWSRMKSYNFFQAAWRSGFQPPERMDLGTFPSTLFICLRIGIPVPGTHVWSEPEHRTWLEAFAVAIRCDDIRNCLRLPRWAHSLFLRCASKVGHYLPVLSRIETWRPLTIITLRQDPFPAWRKQVWKKWTVKVDMSPFVWVFTKDICI